MDTIANLYRQDVVLRYVWREHGWVAVVGPGEAPWKRGVGWTALEALDQLWKKMPPELSADRNSTSGKDANE